MSETDQATLPIDPRYRVIKRYTNRKLYDTQDSRYVTLLQLAEMIRDGQDVRVLDNVTKEDKTEVTLALIISEELKSRPRSLPLATLEALVRHRGGRVLTQLRDGPFGRLARSLPTAPTAGEVPEDGDGADAAAEAGMINRGLLGTLEQWQQVLDERVRTLVPSTTAVTDLDRKIDRLAERITCLERRLVDDARDEE